MIIPKKNKWFTKRLLGVVEKLMFESEVNELNHNSIWYFVVMRVCELENTIQTKSNVRKEKKKKIENIGIGGSISFAFHLHFICELWNSI